MTFLLTGQIPSGKNQVKMTRTGQKYPNKRFKVWRDRAVRELRGQGLPCDRLERPLAVGVLYTPGDHRTRDVPGMLDALWHLFEYIGFVADDKWFREVRWTEMPINKKESGVILDFGFPINR